MIIGPLISANSLGIGLATAHSVIPHSDGSFEAREAPHDEIAAGLARTFVDQKVADAIQALPSHLAEPLSVHAEIEAFTSRYYNGFLNITFQTTYAFRLEAPLPVQSVQDFESLNQLFGLAVDEGKWSVRFYQSPQTARWHLLSAEIPEASDLPTPEPLWIENVSRQTFRVRTQGDEAPVLGGLVFDQYMPVFDQAVDLQRRIPVILGDHTHDFSLRRLSGPPDEEAGLYRLTVTSDSGEWDEGDFPWVSTVSDFALAAAMAIPGETEWHFPMARIDRHTWRMTAAPWITVLETGMEVASIEESEAQFAARMDAAELRKQMELAERLLEQQRWQDILEQDAVERRLWLAQTDGIHMARVLLSRRDAYSEITGDLVEASLQANPFRPWLLNSLRSADWMNSPIHELRETGQIGTLRRFEFTVEALPTGDLIPMEMWVSFYLDQITVERIDIASRLPETNKPELGTPISPLEPQTLYSSVRAHETVVQVEVESRRRADSPVLTRIGDGLLYRRSPEAVPQVRGPVPGTAPNTRPTAPQRRPARSSLVGGGCSSGRCG